MRGKFAGIFENRIRNLQATFKETSVQPQSERDSNRRRQWEQVAKRGQVGFLWAFCRLQEIYTYWRFHFNQQKNKTMYVIAESGDTGLLLYKNIGKESPYQWRISPFLCLEKTEVTVNREVRYMGKSNISQKDAYKLMLKEYPDIMTVEQMCEVLGISTKTGYRLLREKKICCLKVGRAYRIPKAHLFTYLCIGGEETPI